MDKKNIKIALALIVKGDDEEAKLLYRCIENVIPYVDGIFVTITHKKGEKTNKKCLESCHGWDEPILTSEFEWINDFSAARNHNFQVPKEYDYILWCDADDVFRGLEKLKPTIEANPTVDAFAFWYMYEFNDKKQPVVVHKKTQIVRNDGAFEWKGALHEDLMQTRGVDVLFVEGIERMHFTTNERVEVARKRNVEVSENEAKMRPEDPRVQFNLGNSLIGDGQYEKAKEAFNKFLKDSGSDDEKYIAYLRLAVIYDALGDRDGAISAYRLAIGMKPEHSDAYLQLGHLFLSYDDLENAEKYLLTGMVKKPPYHEIIVFNPRDYDYTPMSNLAKVYIRKNRPDLALPMLKGCLEIYPDDEQLKGFVKELQEETNRLEKVVKIVTDLNEVIESGLITDPKEIKKALDRVPDDLKSHPAVCQIRNKYFVKTESSGKDITYYCGLTSHEWNPEIALTKGVGGSEEAVMNLSKQWADLGYNVTVYNNCGSKEMKSHGVTYKPFWEFNHRDKTDILIIWRHPKLLDFDVNASKVYVDMHDVISQGEFNEKRIAKVDKIFVKTQFHRSLFPKVPDDKFAVVPNGMDFGLFNQKEEKDQYLMVNTSSPDRSMDVLPKLFKEIKKQVPQARLKWAYGWDIFDATFGDDKKMMAWRHNIQKEMDEAGIETVGRLSQKDCAKLYLEANILAYPTEFAEIDCITVKKAQACECEPITTDFGAMPESVKHGILIHSPKTKDNWSREFKWSYGIEDEETQMKWVEAVVSELRKPIGDRSEMKESMKRFKWSTIANEWKNIWI